MTQAELIAEATVLLTIGEDQYETEMTKFIADLTAFVPPASTPAPNVLSMTVNFSDSTSQTLTAPGQ